MKKYLAGFLMLGMMFLGGVFVSPSQAQAGLTSVQSQTVINLLSAFGASTATITAVQNALVSTGNPNPSNTGGGSNTGNTNPPSNGCYGTNIYSATTGQLCPGMTANPTNGCYGTNIYSATTGQLCPGMTPPGNNPPTNTPACTSSSNPSITVLSPNGGEVYQSAQQIGVKWQTCNPSVGDKVTIILKSTQTSYGAEIATVPNTGTATITLPTTLGGGQYPVTSGQYYKIRLELGGNAMGYTAPSDDSDNLFTINGSSTNGCYGTNIYSATTGQLCPGMTPPSSNPPSNTSVCAPNNLTAVYPTITINGSQVPCYKSCTNIPSYYPPGPIWNYYTGVLCSNNPNIIVPNTPNPHPTTSITVLSPNGAEQYMQGASIVVKWETTNIPSTNNHIFMLLNYYTPEGVWITNTKLGDGYYLNDGGEQVNLPVVLPAGASWGNNFTVTVGALNDAGDSLGSDSSDKNFSIQ